MKCPKRYVKDIFSCDAFVFEMPQNRIISFSVLKLITCFFFEMPHFFMFVFLTAPFSYLILKMGIMGHFIKNEHKKVGKNT